MVTVAAAMLLGACSGGDGPRSGSGGGSDSPFSSVPEVLHEGARTAAYGYLLSMLNRNEDRARSRVADECLGQWDLSQEFDVLAAATGVTDMGGVELEMVRPDRLGDTTASIVIGKERPVEQAWALPEDGARWLLEC